jgi:hypothetical protein
MNKHNQLSKKNAGLLGAICGSLLIGIPLSSLPGLAKPIAQASSNPCTYQQAPVNPVDSPGAELPARELTPNRIVPADAPTTAATVLNPKPSIFNEPPYNRMGTAATAPAVSPVLPAQTKPPMQPPLPAERSQPIARVMPMDGKVNVRLKNNTNALITYEAIGYTQRRALLGGEEIVLRNLPTPVTITMVRKDDGFLEVMPVRTSEPDLLEVSLDEDATPLDKNQGVLRIQRDGQVFLN